MQAPILEMLSKSSTQPTQQQAIKQMIGTIKAASNPAAYVQSMIQKAITEKNPQMFQALKYIKENGNDAKAAFEKLAAENGINPADIGL